MPLAIKQYEGYSSCPLVTGYGKMILAEFNYKTNLHLIQNLKECLFLTVQRKIGDFGCLKNTDCLLLVLE